MKKRKLKKLLKTMRSENEQLQIALVQVKWEVSNLRKSQSVIQMQAVNDQCRHLDADNQRLKKILDANEVEWRNTATNE